MSRELFALSFTRGFARQLHQRELGDLEHGYPWESLDPSRYPAELVARARLGWTESAFNEFCTAAAMGQLVQAMGEARVPLDLWSLACRFPLEELIHIELCSRVAMRLGGGAPISYDPADLVYRLDPSLTARQRASELVVRLCCVGEALSFPLLSGAMRSAAHPLTRKVLEKIVQDEALHGKLGTWYLDWLQPELTLAERDRLAIAARHTLDTFEELWRPMQSRVSDGVTSEGFLLSDVNELGWMEASAYQALARETVDRQVREPLAAYGIRVR